MMRHLIQSQIRYKTVSAFLLAAVVGGCQSVPSMIANCNDFPVEVQYFTQEANALIPQSDKFAPKTSLSFRYSTSTQWRSFAKARVLNPDGTKSTIILVPTESEEIVGLGNMCEHFDSGVVTFDLSPVIAERETSE